MTNRPRNHVLPIRDSIDSNLGLTFGEAIGREIRFVPSESSVGILPRIDSKATVTPWQTAEPTPYTSIAPIHDYAEEYIRNMNDKNKLFINRNTLLRDIEFDDIQYIMELANKLDEIIKNHFKNS